MPSTTSIPTETSQRCDAKKIKVGDVFSRHSFGKVTGIDTYNSMMTIENSNGKTWRIGAEVMEYEFSFADQFESEEKISRTQLIELITDNPRTAMTIHYNKKPNAKNIAKELRPGKGDLSVKDWDAKVNLLLQGDERVMVGYHNSSFDEHRRLRFNEADKGQRLVDPRTLNWAICNRVKYIVGK
jgi:hypothetical protein